MRCRMMRRSVSSWVSPGPRRPMPPRIRERWVHIRVRRGSRYSSCASSTCSLASWLRARVEKMSRMTSGRSITRTLSSRSRLAPWTGLSSSSKMTSVAPASATAAATSSTLPSPMSVAGLGDAICCEMRPTTSAPAVSTRRVSSSRCSVTWRASFDPLRGAATSTARSIGSRTWISVRMYGSSVAVTGRRAARLTPRPGSAARGPRA